MDDEQTIFQEAAALADKNQRESFIDETCAGDTAMRERVRKMLAIHDAADPPQECASADLAETVITSKPQPHPEGARAGDAGGDFQAEEDQPPNGSPNIGAGSKFEGRYEITQFIGRGGMGAVYRAIDLRLDRSVAIKMLPDQLVESVDALERFRREAKALAALDHPNIVRIYDYGQTDEGQPYFVMEFINGMNIHDLRQGGHLDLTGALEVVSQVCAAMQYAHEKGIIHRDIKPANVMINSDGVVKVADFGLAKSFGTRSRPAHDQKLTGTGAVMGTPDYMAPEQVCGQHVDHRADIYALGAMLYDLLTGSPPRGAWLPPGQKVQVDVRLDEIVVRALQENPVARYQAASEVKDDVDAVKATTGGAPIPPGVAVDPLPSSGLSPVPTPAPGSARPPAPPPSTIHPHQAATTAAILQTTRSTNFTILILGVLGILVLGGLAIKLSNDKKGNTNITTNNISYQEITNYFTNLINLGDVDEQTIQMFTRNARPYGSWVVALSEEAVTAAEARELASQTGAEILDLAKQQETQTEPLGDWLPENFDNKLRDPAWVQENGVLRTFAANGLIGDALPESLSTTTHRVFLCWQPTPEMLEPKSQPDDPTDPVQPVNPLPPVSPAPPPIQANWEFHGPESGDVQDSLPITTTEKILFEDQIPMTSDYALHLRAMMGNDFNVAIKNQANAGLIWSIQTGNKLEDKTATAVEGASSNVSLGNIHDWSTINTDYDKHRIDRTGFIDVLIVRAGGKAALFAGEGRLPTVGDVSFLEGTAEADTVEIFRARHHDNLPAPTALGALSHVPLDRKAAASVLQCDNLEEAMDLLPENLPSNNGVMNALNMAISKIKTQSVRAIKATPKPLKWKATRRIVRKLTRQDGVKLKFDVVLLSADESNVTFSRVSDGKEYIQPISSLSEPDQTLIRGLLTSARETHNGEGATSEKSNQ